MKSPDFEVAIIGAGFGGLGMGIRLKMAGRHSFVIFEKVDELGGTWRDNIYPGCACDIPSLIYSFSFDQNPNWARTYASQPDILAYLKQCAERFEIRSQIRFNFEVTSLTFNEMEGYWRIWPRNGDSVTARVVVSAMGPLNRPYIPRLPDLESFQGKAFHSSVWDVDFDPQGKRIAVIGTGASAIQFIPELAKEAAQLHIFQRTPPWIVPRNDRNISGFSRWLFKHMPVFQGFSRSLLYWLYELRVLTFLGNEPIHKLATSLARKHLENSIADPELRQAVTPDYKIGCKRVLVSDDYYPALQQENVDLITTGIQAIRANSVVGANGIARPVDAIIFGTGFVASEILLDMEIIGRDGRDLLAEWKRSGPEAYLGLSVSGYPNLLFLLGPNTALGHNSVLGMIESQYNYILDYLQLLEKESVSYLDLRPEAQAQFNAAIQEKLKKTVWQTGGCRSWYQTPMGKNTTLWPGSTVDYRARTRKVHIEAYDLKP